MDIEKNKKGTCDYVIFDSRIFNDKESVDLLEYIKQQNIDIHVMSLKHIVRKNTNILKFCRPLFIIGQCDFVEKYFNYFYDISVTNNDYPPSLKKYFFRNINIMKLSEAKQLLPIKSIFIKPHNNTKKFTGKVINMYDNKVSYSLNKNVYVSDIVNFITEYRYFIVNGVICDKKNYYGDENIECNYDSVYDMVNLIKENNEIKGNNYLLDVGVLSTGETALIEINQGYSFGYYGCDLNIVFHLLKNSFQNLYKN